MPQPRTNTHAGLHLLPGASDSLSVVEAWGGPGGVGFYYSAEGGTSLPRRGDYRTIGHPSSITSRHTGVFIGPQPPSPVDTPGFLSDPNHHHESTHRLFYGATSSITSRHTGCFIRSGQHPDFYRPYSDPTRWFLIRETLPTPLRGSLHEPSRPFRHTLHEPSRTLRGTHSTDSPHPVDTR